MQCPNCIYHLAPNPNPNLPLNLALAPYSNDMSLRGAEAIAERRSNLLEVASTAMGLLRHSTCGLALLAMTVQVQDEDEEEDQD